MIQEVSLNGAWELLRDGEAAVIAAEVPGCVHLDLLRAELIEDPYYRDNELSQFWIPETDWTYQRTFQLTPEQVASPRVVLRCEGLDTLAEVTVNGQVVGTSDNMFRTWEFDLAGVVTAGENGIAIRFAAPLPYLRAKEAAERVLPAWGVGQHKLNGGGWLRKSPCSFGWDWGPMCPSSGIWRSIAVVCFSAARLTGVRVSQDHSSDGPVHLTVESEVDAVDAAGLRLRAKLAFADQQVAQARAASPATSLSLTVPEPKLWWPNQMGEQPLYTLTVELLGQDDQVVDRWERRIGLRTLRLGRHDDQWGQSFQFEVNGVPFFAKGGNWIPADTFVPRLTRDDYARLLGDVAAANMNMLRVWGGGIYEQDDFYELCDELGICVWQDFMFACATYPGFDAAFLANVEGEARDNVRRLRHHACLALWCGNNELEQGLVGDEWNAHQMSWDDYRPIFDELLPQVVAAEDPGRDYWPSSPHTPVGDRRDFNNPDCGDAHLWKVWHGKEPFEWYRTCTHRFNSEFGFQSFPEPATVYGYTEPRDRNITSFVMEHHQRSGIGNSTIIHYLLSWFRLPTSFEMTLWLSQVLQGMAMKYACEHWRRQMPRGMGTLYWQINDCWPVASWSSIDSLGRWKALHHLARRFFAPTLISAVEDLASGQVAVHLTADGLASRPAELVWRLVDLDGAVVAADRLAVATPVNGNALLTTLDLADSLAAHGPRESLLGLELYEAGKLVSENLVTFARPKHLELRDPRLELTVAASDDAAAATVTITAEHPALWAWLQVDGIEATWSDNFVHVGPDRPATITVQPRERLSLAELRTRLRVWSLYDTYQ